MGQTYRENNAPIVPGSTNAGFASASHSSESLDRAAACGELKIGEEHFTGATVLVPYVAAPLP